MAPDHPNPSGLSVDAPAVSRGRYLATLAAVTLGYWAFTSVCFMLLARIGDDGLAWPPLAIGIAICTMLGLRYAPAIFLASLVVPMTIGHPAAGVPGATMIQLNVGLWMALADTAGSLAGAWLMHRLMHPTPWLARLRDAALFLLVVAPVSSAVAVGISSLNKLFGRGGPGQHHSMQSPPLELFLERITCNAVAVLLITPVLLSFAGRMSRPRGRRLVEAAAVVLSLLAISLYAFTYRPDMTHNAYALAYLPLPVLIWGTLQYGIRGSTPLALVMCAIAALATIYGRGPLIKGDQRQTILIFWGFCVAASTIALLVGAAVDERRQSMDLLSRSEHRYRELVERAREGIWLLSGRWKTTLVNARMAELLGETPASMIGRGFSEFLNETDIVRVETALVRRVMLADEQQEVCFRRRDGTLVWTLVSTTFLRGGPGEMSGVMALVTDITHRRRAEEELRASRERLEVAIWGTNIGLWDWDLATDDVVFSDIWKQQLGYEPSELPNRFETWESRLHPDDRDRALATVRAYMHSPGRHYESAFRLRQRDGSYRWILARGYMLHNADGKPHRLLGVHIDISDQKRAEEDLQRSNQRLALALAAAQLGTWDWNIADARLTDSPGMAAIFGVVYASDRDPGNLYHALIHPEDRPRFDEEWKRLLEGSGEYASQYRIVRPDGAVRWLASRGALIKDTAGKPVRASGVITDITDRKLAGVERRRLEDQLHRAQKLESLGILAGGVAHDFSNLLSGILGHIGLLQRMVPGDSPLRPTLDIVEHTTRRAGELTRQLLAYSGRGGIVRRHVDLSAVVRDALTLVSSSLSPAASIRLHLATEPVLTEADITQIRQIAMNLISNASDSLEGRAGTIDIRTGECDATREYLDGCVLAERASPGRYVFLEVADSGVGIKRESLPRIFDPFFTTKFTGRGLGLAAVLGSVRGHAGVIRVESTPGAGTTFRVLLAPAGSAASDPQDAPDPLEQHDTPAPHDPHGPRDPDTPIAGAPTSVDAQHDHGNRTQGELELPASGPCRVLVVDDESVVRNMAVMSLEQQGFEVAEAPDGASAVELFRSQERRIDAVLLDLTMPGLTGIETLRRLREINPAVPVVLTSGYTEAEVIEMPADGRTSFLQKPFTIQEMVGQIRSVVSQRR